MVCVWVVPVCDEVAAVDGEGGNANGEHVGEDAAQADQRDEVVLVEEGFDHDPAVHGAGVVESQHICWGVAFRELVEGLDHADVALESAPD